MGSEPIPTQLSEILEDEIAELSGEVEVTGKISPNYINQNIERTLKIVMPEHTKLLYGEKSQRFQRDPQSSSEVINMAAKTILNCKVERWTTNVSHFHKLKLSPGISLRSD